ncbi:MAG: ABC transporter ATP-binding protein, partial [Arenicellales bacterium]|nr:ABC transporter ATP-binding protein [Arenicellales bacterium]
ECHDTGTIEIGGRDVSGTPVAERNIGMVFQNYALFPHMSVYQNVAFGLEMRKRSATEIAKRVDEVLALVSLSDLAQRFPTELSGGQQQRVALARALVINPDILLMDEPLGALDKNLRQSIQLQLRQLHRDIGATIIYVTHDQEEALHLSDRIVILDAGRVVQEGTARDLYF